MRALLLLALLAGPAAAEVVVPVRPIPARHVLAAEDLALAPLEAAGALGELGLAVGRETRVALYPGRAVYAADLSTPAVVERNALLPLVFRAGGLLITAEGRALDRGAAGDLVRVMNLASRATLTARLGADGAAYVSEGLP